MANGDFALSAKCKVMRETDAELWTLFANIEKEFADEDEATREAAHAAAGTLVVMIWSRDGRLRSRWRDPPHRRDARWEARVRPNKIEWGRYAIFMSTLISRGHALANDKDQHLL